MTRLYREAGLERGTRPDGHTRLRWQAEHAGALWHGDVCHGPALRVGGTTMPLRIHALLDDASRYVVALEARHTERAADMLDLMLAALRRHGAPDGVYLDNGSTYRGDGLRLCCERLDITLVHARPGDAPARGKMERLWRTGRSTSRRWPPRSPSSAAAASARTAPSISMAGPGSSTRASSPAGSSPSSRPMPTSPVSRTSSTTATATTSTAPTPSPPRVPAAAGAGELPPPKTPFDPAGALLDRSAGRPPRHRKEGRS